jgi:ABC-type Fe3+/spermidine/putrescine transport system ATPase subunit
LDRTLREDLLNELRRILHHTNIPAIYVTHDQEEAFALADRVLILHNGQIIREGTPVEVWEHPGSVFVAGFLGLGNIIEGKVKAQLAVSNAEGKKEGEWKVESRLGVVTVSCEHKHQKGERVHLLARPLSAENARVPEEHRDYSERSRDEPNAIVGVVTDVIFLQDRFKVTLDNGLYIYLQEAPQIGESIEVRVEVECLA